MKVLIVDDSALQQRMMKDSLVKLGYSDFSFAGDFETAMQEFESHLPDLVLLDIMLPGRNGMDVFQAMRRKKAVPIVVVTSISMQAFQEALDRLDLPLTDVKIQHPVYLTKPFTTDQLRAAIRTALQQ
ncbi:MAG: response regulator transcription factor [Nanobdellota archaeon]